MSETTAAPAASPKAPKLSLVPRDPRYVVMIEDRIPRADVALFQIAIPREIHHKLQHETYGSLAQVTTALIRYALERLDAENQTLKVNLP